MTTQDFLAENIARLNQEAAESTPRGLHAIECLHGLQTMSPLNLTLLAAWSVGLPRIGFTVWDRQQIIIEVCHLTGKKAYFIRHCSADDAWCLYHRLAEELRCNAEHVAVRRICDEICELIRQKKTKGGLINDEKRNSCCKHAFEWCINSPNQPRYRPLALCRKKNH